MLAKSTPIFRACCGRVIVFIFKIIFSKKIKLLCLQFNIWRVALNMNEEPLASLYSEYKRFEVDISHIIEDLLEHYSFELDQAAIVENMDNCIDERNYKKIEFSIKDGILSISMYGSGIPPQVFNSILPTIAGTTKTSREGLGHYGWGMKVGLGISEKMVIKTKIGNFKGAQEWLLDPKGIPIYKLLDPPDLPEDMTVVEHFLTKKYRESVDLWKIKQTLNEFYPTLLGGAPVLGRRLEVFVNGEKIEWKEPDYDKRCPIKIEVDGKEATGYLYYKKEGYAEDFEKINIIVYGRAILKDTFGILTNKKISGYIHADFLSSEVTGDKTTIRRNSSLWKKLSKEIGRKIADFLREVGELKEEYTLDSDLIKQLHRQINNTIKFFPDLFKEFRAAQTKESVLIADANGSIPSEMAYGSQKTTGTKGGPGTGGGVLVEGDNLKKQAPISSESGDALSVRKERKVRSGIQIKWTSSDERKEAWFDYAEGIVWINTRFSTYQKAEQEGKKVLQYHCARCVFDSLLEHVIRTQMEGRLDEFFNYRNEILSKWCEQ